MHCKIFESGGIAAGFALMLWLLGCGFGAAKAETQNPERLAVLAPAARIPAEAIDIEALTLQSDFTVFLAAECPEALRLKGLRRLWRLLPLSDVQVNSAI